MALESKPIFHPEVLRQQVRSFALPDQTAAWQPKLQHWAELISSGRADDFKESALLPDFLSDIFCGLLGYTGPAQAADSYTLYREKHVEAYGEFTDAFLGHWALSHCICSPAPTLTGGWSRRLESAYGNWNAR